MVLMLGCGDTTRRRVNLQDEKGKADTAWRHKGKTDIFEM